MSVNNDLQNREDQYAMYFPDIQPLIDPTSPPFDVAGMLLISATYLCLLGSLVSSVLSGLQQRGRKLRGTNLIKLWFLFALLVLLAGGGVVGALIYSLGGGSMISSSAVFAVLGVLTLIAIYIMLRPIFGGK